MQLKVQDAWIDLGPVQVAAIEFALAVVQEQVARTWPISDYRYRALDVLEEYVRSERKP